MGADLRFPLKLDPFPLGNPPTIGGFSHVTIIPDGSPNNTFGVWFGPDALPGCAFQPMPQMNAGFGNRLGQTTAMDSTDVIWDGVDWTFVAGRQPRIDDGICAEFARLLQHQVERLLLCELEIQPRAGLDVRYAAHQAKCFPDLLGREVREHFDVCLDAL